MLFPFLFLNLLEINCNLISVQHLLFDILIQFFTVIFTRIIDVYFKKIYELFHQVFLYACNASNTSKGRIPFELLISISILVILNRQSRVENGEIRNNSLHKKEDILGTSKFLLCLIVLDLRTKNLKHAKVKVAQFAKFKKKIIAERLTKGLKSFNSIFYNNLLKLGFYASFYKVLFHSKILSIIISRV